MSIQHVRIERDRPRRPPGVSDIRTAASHQTISEQFSRSYEEAGLSGKHPDVGYDKAPSRSDQIQHVSVEYGQTQALKTRPRRKKKRANLAQKAAVRVRVSGANAWTNSWVMFMYVTFQLPFAIVSTVGFGIAAFIYAAIEQTDEIEGVTGFIVRAGIRGLETVAGAFGETLSQLIIRIANTVFGISFDPMALFFIGYFVVLSFGMMQLMLAWFLYTGAGIHSLSGEAAGAKIGTFLLAAVGICLPVLNLFPLILFWTTVVWFKPR